MRKNIVAGNWKMNLSSTQAEELIKELARRQHEVENVTLMVFPPSLFLERVFANRKDVLVGAQNFHPAEKGAFTGEISVSQVSDCGVNYFLVGHSERRELFGEDHDFIRAKVDSALSHNGNVIFCCGEPLDIREKELQNQYVKQQLEDSLFHLSEEELLNCVVAYEPVWAIGTGRTASTQQAEEMHASIRSWISEKYGASIAEQISILYGGSCNTSNAKELFACPNVDGGLIGGASLDADSFLNIARSF